MGNLESLAEGKEDCLRPFHEENGPSVQDQDTMEVNEKKNT